MNPWSPTITRRRALGLTAAAAAGAALPLSGCSGPGNGGGGAPTTPLALPAYRPSEAVTPDLISAAEGGMPTFFGYPVEPPRSVTAAPLQGGRVSAMTFSYDPSAPGVDQNPLWQAVNRSLGGDLDVAYTPVGDYGQRFSTAVAGGDLPDLVAVKTPIPQLPRLLRSRFTDLAPFLSGDAVLDFPNLAALPTSAWRAAAVEGGLWGVPIPRPPIAATMYVRGDLVAAVGGRAQPQSFEELADLLASLTDARQRRWAMTDPLTMLDFVALSHGLGAQWYADGDRLTHVVERPEYVEALNDVKALVDRGVFHPDGITANNNQRNGWFTAGTVAMIHTGFTGWSKFIAWGAEVPGYQLATMVPVPRRPDVAPAASRGGPVSHFTSIPTADEGRVRQLLSVLDWLSAPFGTAEYLTKAYGVEGETFRRDGTTVEWTDLGNAVRTIPFLYVGDNVQVIYQPGATTAPAQFDYQEKAAELLQPDPVAGLYSETNAGKGATLSSDLAQGRTDILAGRRPVTDWPTIVDRWRTDGGDTMRTEYQQARQDA